MKRPPRRWRRAIVLALVAAVLPAAARALAGPPGAAIHVRWQPQLATPDRLRLEARFGLADGTPVDGDTWAYDLTDTSTQNIRALVAEPAAADTHNIERPSGTLTPGTPVTVRHGLGRAGDRVVALADRLALILTATLGLLLVAPVARRSVVWRETRGRMAPWFEPLPAPGRAVDDRSGGAESRWTGLVLLLAVPLVLSLCWVLWRSPFPISEAVALLEDTSAQPLGFFFTPDKAYYRPLFYVTLAAFWNGAGSLAATLAWIKLLTIASVLVLIVALVRHLRPRSALDAAAATVATAVLLGSPGFRDNLELVLTYTIVGMPCILLVWMLLDRPAGRWHTPLIVGLTIVALGFKEQGLVIVPLVLLAWWTGAPGASSRVTAAVFAVGSAYLAVRLSGAGSWEPFEQSIGLGFIELEREVANERYGAFPYWIYAYNVVSTMANVLFSEPARGTYQIVRALVYGEAQSWHVIRLWSSTVMTALIVWWGVRALGTVPWRSWIHSATGKAWSDEARLFVALVVAVLACGALSFNYSRDRLGGMAAVFYALASYHAVKAAAESALRTNKARVVVAGFGLALLALAWDSRAIGTLEWVRTQSKGSEQEWLATLAERRIEFSHRPVYLAILEAMVPQGTAPGAPQPTRYPEWAQTAIGRP